ncbi:hypothetical protein QQ045_024314 [Rhodiola kirilowii]
MIIRSPEPEVKILVDRDPVKTSFEEWARPGHFSRTLAKGPDTTTWIWNLHADAHDFDSHTSDLEEISRKVFSAHFGQLSIIFLWLSGMYFHGARFSNYEAWLSDPTHIGPSAQVVWPIVGQEILNGDVGGGFRGIQITSGFFQIWRASGITSELQLYCTAIGALIFSALMLFAAIAILFLIAGHMYRTNWGIGHGLKDILEAHKGPFTGQGHKGLYEILTTSWHAQLSLNLAMLGSLTIVVAHHMYAMPPYPYLATDYAPSATAPGATTGTSLTWGGGDLVAVGGKVALLPIPLGTADFLVHHIHAFTIHVTVLILLKGVLFARSSRLIPDKANLGFRFPCDGPGRGGTCQVSAWDHVFLGLFWMYNAISVVIFHFSWKMQSDVWGSISDQGVVTHITGGNFAQSSITINGWLRDFLWAQASQVIQSYGSSLSAYGLFFLGAHFVWAFSLMFLFSGRGYWQELIESIVWAHNKLKVAPATQPRALSIVQGRAVGVTHYLLGGIATTWAFFLARIIAVG